MKVFIFLVFLCLSSSIFAAQSKDPEVKTIKGLVIRQIHGCEVDIACAVVIKTDQGEVSVTWNQGMTMPPSNCSSADHSAADDASYLIPGDKVEIHLPVASGGILCGPGASVTRLDIPNVSTRTIRGLVAKQNIDCTFDSKKSCSVIVRADVGDEEVIWQRPYAGVDFSPQCREVKTRYDVGSLKPGDDVEIRLPTESGNIFCGDGASVKVVPDTMNIDDPRIVEGVIIDKSDGCRQAKGNGVCSITLQTGNGYETFVTGYRDEWHPLHCSFGLSISEVSSLSIDDEVELHVPTSSHDVVCGMGSVIIKRNSNPIFREEAKALPPAAPGVDSTMRVVRGILIRKPLYLLIETGKEIEHIDLGSRTLADGSHCDAPAPLMTQLLSLKVGDAVELHLPIASGRVFCGTGASVKKLSQ